jgi:hypothetical protein
MARGPLFQLAITPDTHQRRIQGNITLDVAPELSNNYAMADDRQWFGGDGLPPGMLSLIRNVSAQVPIRMNYTGCDGQCTAKIKVRNVRGFSCITSSRSLISAT